MLLSKHIKIMDIDDIIYLVLDVWINRSKFRTFVSLSLLNKQWCKIVREDRYWNQLTNYYHDKLELPSNFSCYWEYFVYMIKRSSKLTSKVNFVRRLSNTTTFYDAFNEFTEEERYHYIIRTTNFENYLENGYVFEHRYKPLNMKTLYVYWENRIINVDSFPAWFYWRNGNNLTKIDITAHRCPAFRFPEFPLGYWSNYYSAIQLVFDPIPFLDEMEKNFSTIINKKWYLTRFTHNDFVYNVHVMIYRKKTTSTLDILRNGTWLYIHDGELCMKDLRYGCCALRRLIVI